MMERPAAIQPHHLEKLAVVYVRQSSPYQVRENVGSTDVQRGLVNVAMSLGWDNSRISCIDGDQGRSASIAGQRSDFRHLLDIIDEGSVSLVLLNDFSRASRNTREGEGFLSRILEHQLLIWVNGKLFNGASEELAEVFNLKL
jgi:DNA invertase Pin-like site-specific DNA recombinase